VDSDAVAETHPSTFLVARIQTVSSGGGRAGADRGDVDCGHLAWANAARIERSESAPGPERCSVGNDIGTGIRARAPSVHANPIGGVRQTVPREFGSEAAGREPGGQTTFPSIRLEEVRTRARRQAQSGQIEQALSSVVEGLQIDPGEPALRSIQGSLLRDAQARAVRARQDAETLDASARAEEPFERGLEAAKQAIALRRAGKIDAAARSFLAAADEFGAAAVEARKIADAEEAEQARVKAREKRAAGAVGTAAAERQHSSAEKCARPDRRAGIGEPDAPPVRSSLCQVERGQRP
jgi:hypothetical protein